ncbi:FCD domain-containing protein [Actinopolymorpha sp. NPDC004070]|uniref:FCD domain-containing protein n=1 Tax=Actinopolymorpha sp. NPDC004070 TaxID=3154548 RepID=UPI0033A01DE0
MRVCPKEHQAITAAIREHDPDAAEKAMRAHTSRRRGPAYLPRTTTPDGSIAAGWPDLASWTVRTTPDGTAGHDHHPGLLASGRGVLAFAVKGATGG